MEDNVKMSILSEDNLNRLVKFIIIKFEVSPMEAYKILENFKLTLICGSKIFESKALQAALITAVNCGNRSFLGGVEVIMPSDIPLLVNWPGHETLNNVVKELGGDLVKQESNNSSFTLLFGVEANLKKSLHVICNGWVGGISELMVLNPPAISPDFALGGVMAGALGVAGAFFRVTKLRSIFGSDSIGISLWKPHINWLLPEANGCELKILPQKLWVLGLGHLGQAYLWSLGLLKGSTDKKMEILLQDFDVIKNANFSTGLLSEKSFIGQKKTRVCARWLEHRGIETTIIEQRFNAQTRRDTDDPRVAVCGFDKAEPRKFLEDAGFDFIIEAGLGASIDDFDNFLIHTFPNYEMNAKTFWSENNLSNEIDQKVRERFLKEIGPINGCGIMASTLAGKAIASAFVGATAGAFVIAEILRGLHGESHYGILSVQLRSLEDVPPTILPSSQNLLALNGFISLI